MSRIWYACVMEVRDKKTPAVQACFYKRGRRGAARVGGRATLAASTASLHFKACTEPKRERSRRRTWRSAEREETSPQPRSHSEGASTAVVRKAGLSGQPRLRLSPHRPR